jgi:hypothetical protein
MNKIKLNFESWFLLIEDVDETLLEPRTDGKGDYFYEHIENMFIGFKAGSDALTNRVAELEAALKTLIDGVPRCDGLQHFTEDYLNIASKALEDKS